MSTFGQWKRQALAKRFGLTEKKSHPDLLLWVNSHTKVGELTTRNLLRLLRQTSDKFWDFNEWELALKVIAKIIQEVNFDGNAIRSFSLRDMRATIDNEELNGKPDWVVATGSQDPEKPYFFLQEHKKSFDNEGDPIGQCLAAMLVAQTLNQEPNEILYGSFVVGADWYFMILKGKEYSISLPYSTTKEIELLQIYQILKTLKIRLFTMLGEELEDEE
jgi:hypothetical protein